MYSAWQSWATAVALLVLAINVNTAHCFRVVAFGDSFTEGWDPQAQTKVPYTDTLRTCLRKVVGRRIGISVDNRGKGWAGVLMKEPGTNLTENVIKDIAQIQASKVKYDWAILWIAGVNDIVNAKPPHPYPYRMVLRKYKQLWELCLQQGWDVLVMPQPTFMFSSPGKGPEKLREKLAQQLHQWVHDAALVNPRLHWYNLTTAMDGYKMAPQTAALYYSRRNHFSIKGYQRVGNLVCHLLGPYALAQVPKATSTTVTAKVAGPSGRR